MALVLKGGIGGGDIKVMTLVAFLLGWDFYYASIIMLAMTLIIAFYGIIKGKGLWFSVPYIPFISIGYLGALIFKMI